jgi:hypothetical protein
MAMYKIYQHFPFQGPQNIPNLGLSECIWQPWFGADNIVTEMRHRKASAPGTKILHLAKERLGVDVMITIFCDFRQFPVKKMAFFSKTNVMIKILHNLAVF